MLMMRNAGLRALLSAHRQPHQLRISPAGEGSGVVVLLGVDEPLGLYRPVAQ
jgi:hypothetical protein